MIQSKLMPIMVRIFRLRWRYELQGLKHNQFYHVIGYDTKRLIITNEQADHAYTVKWKDVELVKSEMVIAQSRPNTALLTEMQLLRRAMGKLSTAVPKLKNMKETENRPQSPISSTLPKL